MRGSGFDASVPIDENPRGYAVLASALVASLILAAAPSAHAARARARCARCARSGTNRPRSRRRWPRERPRDSGPSPRLRRRRRRGPAWPLSLPPASIRSTITAPAISSTTIRALPDSCRTTPAGNARYDLDSGYNHAGTDYYLWPYPWLMMDLDEVRIVAAAPGVIAEKIDGNFDRDCAIAGNGGFNAVFVQQDDGLTAWYLHMKNGFADDQAGRRARRRRRVPRPRRKFGAVEPAAPSFRAARRRRTPSSIRCTAHATPRRTAGSCRSRTNRRASIR